MKHGRILGRIAVALLCAVPLAAQRGGGPPERGPGGGSNCTDALVAAVGLTAAQQTALTTLRQQTADAVKALAEQGRALHDQIETALEAATPDKCAIGDLVIQGYKLHEQIDAARTAAEAAFVASLSSDQQAKYTAFLATSPRCTAIPARGPGARPGA